MSRGLGSVQQKIIDLIAADADGAWTVTQLCEHVYGGIASVEKKHRVAVARALRHMKLPGTWQLGRCRREHALVDVCNSESMARLDYWGHRNGRDCFSDFEVWKRDNDGRVDGIRERAREAQRYRDASPVGKLEIEIKDAQTALAMAQMVGSRDWAVQIAKRIVSLQQKLRQDQPSADAMMPTP